MNNITDKMEDLFNTVRKTDKVTAVLITADESEKDTKITKGLKGDLVSVEALICLLIKTMADNGKVSVNKILNDIVGALSEED